MQVLISASMQHLLLVSRHWGLGGGRTKAEVAREVACTVTKNKSCEFA